MARIIKTGDYLERLHGKGYAGFDSLFGLYNEWKEKSDIGAFSSFLESTWKEKDRIKPKYLGENSYNNLRGIAFEEFCFDVLDRTINESGAENLVELFWNEKIMTDEFHVLENGQFKKYPKHKAVDIAIGKREDTLIHPMIIISCKIWQSTNWLDEDRAVFDSIRNRYPNVFGYCLCMGLSVPSVSLISSQRTGLKVFDLSEEENPNRFLREIKEILIEVKQNNSGI